MQAAANVEAYIDFAESDTLEEDLLLEGCSVITYRYIYIQLQPQIYISYIFWILFVWNINQRNDVSCLYSVLWNDTTSYMY